MRRLGILAAVCALATVLVGGVTSAGTASLLTGTEGTAASVHKLDLSSMAKIRHYLRSIGIDPRTVVIQRGHRNYAGPRCPGRRWTCTRATRVVQIASSGQNNFTCTPAATGTDEPSNTCVVVQHGPSNNQARCDEQDTTEPTSTELCIITQDGAAENIAIVHQEIDQSMLATQEGRQIADVKQTATGKNDAEIYQSISQGTSADSSQDQEGHQVAFVKQFVSSGSENFSHVHQTQDQRESGNATTQKQNTELAPNVTITVAGTDHMYDFNCGPEKPVNPDQCANVCQTSAATCPSTGTPPETVNNESHLHQAIAEDQSTNVVPTLQQQGLLTSGQEGDIHQENPVGLGINHDHPHQNLGQHQKAPPDTPTSAQQQSTDPGCCGISQIGGMDNVEPIQQATTMSASESNAAQNSALFGEVHQTSPGGNDTCSIDQHGRTNSGAGHFSMNGNSFEECAELEQATTCTNVVEGNLPSCAPTPVCPEPPCIVVPILSIATTPTYGQDITMPSFSEPTDYVPFGG